MLTSKLSLVLTTAAISSFVSIYIYSNIDDSKLLNVQKSVEQNKIKIETLEKVSPKIVYKEVLPNFVKNDLKNHGINPETLTKETWAKFLDVFKHGNLKNLSQYLDSEESLLNLAIKTESKILVEYLLNNGFDVNAQDKEGNTPLTNAFIEGDLQIIRILVDNGADITYTNKDGDMLNHALRAKKSNEELISYLKLRGFALNSSKYFMDTMKLKNNKITSELISNISMHGIPPPPRLPSMEKDKYLPLPRDVKISMFEHVLKYNYPNNIIEQVLRKDIKIVPTKRDFNELHAAALNDKIIPENILEIIKRGADVNALIPQYNVTPLMLSIKSKNIVMVDVLLRNGADSSLLDSRGKSAFDYLAENKDLSDNERKVIEALLKKQKLDFSLKK